ncbi:type II secretion system protein GspK [Sphingomonas sp. DG1-23]|uniref:general secretion pathway protein GspK n=1 Tax=Sphingomonas sp. DG1-23 TaxID=3068316 RepID=UPI00273EFFAF|nr:type II secretion system protein GspK [Sphingomonas sp. DG1-23]MDP5281246.1 type II secretion system protein GspK [Sphingomonas sp. DG1-23]
MTRGHDEEGMILVNVLMFVAIAAGLVLLMINREELALDRGLRTREAARALAIVRGGELSALVALRRDAEQSPEVDHLGEPWAKLSESGAAIDGGSFDLAIADAEGRFNINSVRTGQVAATILFQTIGNQVGLTPEQIVAAVEYVRLRGPVTDLRPLRMAGIEPKVADRLERLVTALPGTTTLNLNAADQEMLALLFRDPLVAGRLVAIRDRQGFLTAKDLTDQNVSLPSGTSFRSNTFWVRTRATIGGTSQQAATLIQRRRREDASVEVVPVERWRNAAVPPGAPPLPAAKG